MGIFNKIKDFFEAKQIKAERLTVTKGLTVGNTEYGEQTITFIDKNGKERSVTVLVGHKGR